MASMRASEIKAKGKNLSAVKFYLFCSQVLFILKPKHEQSICIGKTRKFASPSFVNYTQKYELSVKTLMNRQKDRQTNSLYLSTMKHLKLMQKHKTEFKLNFV